MLEFTKEVNDCLLKLQQGDDAQLGLLFNLTANHLRGIAIRYLFDKNSAGDVVSEVFLKIDKYIASYRKGENGYNWMCKITQNTAQTYNKKQLIRTLSEQKFVYGCDSDYYDKNIDNIDFISQFKDLSPMDKEIVYRWLFLDEQQQIIGDKLNLSKVAVNKRIKNICKIAENLLNK